MNRPSSYFEVSIPEVNSVTFAPPHGGPVLWFRRTTNRVALEVGWRTHFPDRFAINCQPLIALSDHSRSFVM